MYRIVLFFLVLLSCSSAHAPTSASIPRPTMIGKDQRQKAILFANKLFPLKGLLSPVPYSVIYWSNGTRVTVGSEPLEYWGVSMDFFVRDIPICSSVVSTGGHTRVSQTSFMHELLHCSLMLSHRDPDPQHLRKEWRLLKELNSDLQTAGM